MCETSNYAAPPATAWLIFAKQSARRNDILREEVCHFWTAHSAFASRVEEQRAIAVLLFVIKRGHCQRRRKQIHLSARENRWMASAFALRATADKSSLRRR